MAPLKLRSQENLKQVQIPTRHESGLPRPPVATEDPKLKVQVQPVVEPDATVLKASPTSEHGSVEEEDLPPLKEGLLRIRGTVIGETTSPAHHMELALPLDVDIPFKLLVPVLRFCAGHGGVEGDRANKHAWDQLLERLAPDFGIPPRSSMQAGRFDKHRAELESELQALHVECEARGEALKRVEQEVSELKKELLQLALGSPEVAKTISPHIADRLGTPSQPDVCNGTSSPDSSPKADVEDSNGEKAEEPVAKGRVLLSGSYIGYVTTSKHRLEVSLPIESNLPEEQVAEVAMVLGDLVHDGPTNVGPVWREVADLLGPKARLLTKAAKSSRKNTEEFAKLAEATKMPQAKDDISQLTGNAKDDITQLAMELNRRLSAWESGVRAGMGPLEAPPPAPPAATRGLPLVGGGMGGGSTPPEALALRQEVQRLGEELARAKRQNTAAATDMAALKAEVSLVRSQAAADRRAASAAKEMLEVARRNPYSRVRQTPLGTEGSSVGDIGM